MVLKGLLYQKKEGKGRVVRMRTHKHTKSFKILAHCSTELELFGDEKSGVTRGYKIHPGKQCYEVAERAFTHRCYASLLGESSLHSTSLGCREGSSPGECQWTFNEVLIKGFITWTLGEPSGDKSWFSHQEGLGELTGSDLSRTSLSAFHPFAPTAPRPGRKQKETLRSTLHELWTALGLGANEVT